MNKHYLAKCQFIILIITLLVRYGYSNPLTTLKKIRVGKNPEGVRIVIDLDKKADFQIRALKDPSKIHIDIFDGTIPPKKVKIIRTKDTFLKRIEVKQVNLRQVRVDISLAYGVPVENIHVFTLKKPYRIVVDIYRNYSNFIQFYITKNILWMQIERASHGRFTLINELYVNHKSPTVRVKVELSKNKGKGETVTSMVKRTGAIAGVNGGFFVKNKSLGLVVIDGKIVSPSVKTRPPRTAFAIDFYKRILFNRVVSKRDKLITMWGRTWKDIVTALGAGPRLISSGKIHVTAKEEGLGKGGNDITRRTGRTTLGINKDGNLVFMTVSGYRSNKHDGMKLEEIAQYMLKRGIVDGMNLDGGGSTAMSIMGTLVSKPPMHGKFQRPVANAVLIFDKSPIISPCYINIFPPRIKMPADGVTSKVLRIYVLDKEGNPVPDGVSVSLSPQIGLFDKKFYYTKRGVVKVVIHSLRAVGTYSIKIDAGPVRRYFKVNLTLGKPKDMFVRIKPIKKDKKSKKYIVEVLVRDEFKNPYPNKPIKLTLVRGKGHIKEKTIFTRKDGVADTTVVIKTKEANLLVTSDSLPPCSVILR